MIHVYNEELTQVFNQWCLPFFSHIPPSSGISFDGKCLRSTVENAHNNSRNWVTIVSAFSQATGLVLKLAQFQHQMSSEIEQIQEMIKDFPYGPSVFKASPTQRNKYESSGWSQIKSLIRVERWGFRGDDPYDSTMYYMSSLSAKSCFTGH